MISEWLNKDFQQYANRLIRQTRAGNSLGGYALKKRVERLIYLLQSAMYPSIYYEEPLKESFAEAAAGRIYQEAAMLLYEICTDVLPYCEGVPHCEGEGCADPEESISQAETITRAFMESLPDIAAVLDKDITAAYDGDPAARSREEVMLAYPAFETITIFRLAHRLFELGMPLLPRMMTEYAHSRTGIDIHPGATIGEYFFIDHGTGVVIGETCRIGRHVKLYQGVTLGARSFDLDEQGHPVKGGKRHPDVEDRVVIYAGATILGGDVVIGKGSIIGGSVWLTSSVPPYSIIYNTAKSISVSQNRNEQ